MTTFFLFTVPAFSGEQQLVADNENPRWGETFIQGTDEFIQYEIIDGRAVYDGDIVLGDPDIIDIEGVPYSRIQPHGNAEADDAIMELENPNHTAYITKGRIYNGHPAVGRVDSICTGTLIGKRTVLTAAHCLEGSRRATFKVGGRLYDGNVTRHPNYNDNDHHGTFAADIAVIRLDEAVPGIRPIPLCNTARNLRDLDTTIIGYGQKSYENLHFGTKRRGRNTITNSSRNIIWSINTNSQVCYGDSGGPALLDKTDGSPQCIIGVASYTYWCKKGMGHTRPDGHRGWINRNRDGDGSVRWVKPCQRKCRQDEYEGKKCWLACDRSCTDEMEGPDDCYWYRKKDNRRN